MNFTHTLYIFILYTRTGLRLTSTNVRRHHLYLFCFLSYIESLHYGFTRLVIASAECFPCLWTFYLDGTRVKRPAGNNSTDSTSSFIAIIRFQGAVGPERRRKITPTFGPEVPPGIETQSKRKSSTQLVRDTSSVRC